MNCRIISKIQPTCLKYARLAVGLLFVIILCGMVIQDVSAAEKPGTTQGSGPDVAIIDASVKMDISEMEDIPLGTIPDERLIVTITVQNTGNREAPGFKLRAYLVRVGREDEIGTQIGGDITDTRLGAGETRVYSKSWSMPEHLKKGEYRVMVVLDSSNYFEEADTENNRITGKQPVVPGVLTGPEGSVPVYSPAEITKPGYYVLKRDISGGKRINIFEIKASGVTFDGGGNTIRGISSGFTSGIYIDAGNALRDIVIKNFVFEGVDAGIWMYKVSNAKIENCIFRNTANMGLRLDQSNQNEITGNTFEHNAMGIGIFQSKDNTIYNNLFKNIHNAAVNEDNRNAWNTALKAGTNIIGGGMIGGNAWLDETGEAGFSATAQDYTHDGISDAPYSLNPNNIDLYPLITAHKPATVSTPVFVENPEEISEETVPVEENLTTTPPPSEITPIPTPPQRVETWLDTPSSPAEENGTNTILTPQEETVTLPAIHNTTLPTPTETEPAEESEVLLTDTEQKSPLSPYADIRVKEVSMNGSGCPGGDVDVSAVVENAGGYDADSFQARFYLSEDKKVDSRDILLEEITITNLGAGSEETISRKIVIPELIGLKNYFLAMVTNTDNSIFEDKKENNAGFSFDRLSIREC